MKGGESTKIIKQNKTKKQTKKIKFPPLALLLTQVNQVGINFFSTGETTSFQKRRLRYKEPSIQNDKSVAEVKLRDLSQRVQTSLPCLNTLPEEQSVGHSPGCIHADTVRN